MAPLNKWPSVERPRERLRRKGAPALGDAELLAILLGTGSEKLNAFETASEAIRDVGGVHKLAQMGIGGLKKLSGIGEAKAMRILASIELGIRIVERHQRQADATSYTCSEDLYRSYRTRLGMLPQEVFLVVGLNTRNQTVRETTVARGSINECVVHPREVFRPLIAEAAAKVILVHNHPSGDPTPSPEDVALTRRLAEAGRLLGISVVDHVIIARNSYASLRDLGLFDT